MPNRKPPDDNVTPFKRPTRKSASGKPNRIAKSPEAKARQEAAGRRNLQTRRDKYKEVGPKPKGEKSRLQKLIDGEIKVTDLDDEELYRMQTRDRLGDFSGRPGNVPLNVVRAMKAESIKRGQAIIDANISKATEFLASVITSPEARVADKIKASEILMARGMGSVPQHVVNHEGSKWDEMVEGDEDGVAVIYDTEEGTA